MQEQWLTKVNDLIERKTFHRVVRDETAIELRLLELGLTAHQRDQVMEMMYDFQDEPNPKARRNH
jgi:hypothetical protein